MMIFWLVMTGQWDVFGTATEDLPVGPFLVSAALCALEFAAELYWIGRLFE